MRKKILSFFIFIVTCFFIFLLFQEIPAAVFSNNISNERTFFRVMFYNVENLFDPIDDSLTKDDEFTPTGNKYWTWKKYNKKLLNIYKVIVACGGWDLPEIIGLCEIENKRVLEDLTKNTPLLKYTYDYIHKESPDIRGIDVALLYNKNKFSILEKKFLEINFPSNKNLTTRDILYVKGIIINYDTLHVFVNHWPSRRGGILETESLRVSVAMTLRNVIDSILITNPYANILLMGDFNDEPNNKSIRDILKASADNKNHFNDQLYNLSFTKSSNIHGTYKYKGRWQLFDQFIASGELLNKKSCIYIAPDTFTIFNEDFLLVKDKSGSKPFRTFLGYRYQEGFSDHLPVFLDIFLKKKEY